MVTKLCSELLNLSGRCTSRFFSVVHSKFTNELAQINLPIFLYPSLSGCTKRQFSCSVEGKEQEHNTECCCALCLEKRRNKSGDTVSHPPKKQVDNTNSTRSYKSFLENSVLNYLKEPTEWKNWKSLPTFKSTLDLSEKKLNRLIAKWKSLHTP